MFDWDDSVALVQTVRAPSVSDAMRIAEVVSQARPRLAGYQLWHRGERVAATFPTLQRRSAVPSLAIA
jgi:hypothetical protein